ncbi:3-phosphoshikimate 1-carboxyvinyltransferase [Flavobacteriaceae bacterium MAR_2010_188]|nr:3-phosphoshikimate 1-carboxyvinyltransferase [Flavobacteriaceae bacterium MAR_2010_188]
MVLTLTKSEIISGMVIDITGSKSESNRLLILQALFPAISINNLSNSDDSEAMQKALSAGDGIIDIHHAGTAMRFLTAYFSTLEGRNVTLTGSPRMKERPIEILVSALKDLGADIEYVENQGCPPLRIQGKKLSKCTVALDANVSSQYISALMLVAPSLPKGLEINLKGKVTSVPYINMTLKLLQSIGVEGSFVDNQISIAPKDSLKEEYHLTVESDWSSASYFYSIVALSEPGTTISLNSYKVDSLQGDSILAEIYQKFQVETSFMGNTITLKKLLSDDNINIDLDLSNSPDIAQTIAVTCLGLGIACKIGGLHTLKIKETDRLQALKNEIEKLGGTFNITKDSLELMPIASLNESVEIETYNDHRMAMAFAPLALNIPIAIKDYEVVSKSYPTFWDDLKTVGFRFSK